MFGIDVVGGIIKEGFGLAKRFVTDKTEKLKVDSELAKIALVHAQEGKMVEFKDVQQSRMMFAKEMDKAPMIVRLMNGIVRPFGGLGALATVFWVIWAPYFGYPQLDLPELNYNNPIWAIITAIISFYFFYRHKAKSEGIHNK